MWVRKRIEINAGYLLYGLWRCLLPGDREKSIQRISQLWNTDEAFVCLSVRSGFDLILQCFGWKPGSEIIMSGLTIPDMPRIVRENNMVPVGVDIDLDSMAPDAEQIEQAITPRTRAIVVAHLLGGVCNIDQILEVAKKHGLEVIEDCAQAYIGRRYQGHPLADVSMFSFGPIKTNTALGGAVFRVRDSRRLENLKSAHRRWPTQTHMNFGRRSIKYAFVKLMSTRLACGTIYRLMRFFGSNHDKLASCMARGFAGPRFFERIRRQPSTSLLRLLETKLDTYQEQSAARRKELGEIFVDTVGRNQYVLGSRMNRQTYWVLPMLVDDPQPLVEHLWTKGFDASNNCSLEAICDDVVAKFILEHIVFLPLHVQMPRSEILRMANEIRKFGPNCPEMDFTSIEHFEDEYRAAALSPAVAFSKSAMVGEST